MNSITPSVTRVMNDSSLEISKNSRGFTYSIKAYGQDNEVIAEKARDLKQKAEELIGQGQECAEPEKPTTETNGAQ